MIALDNEPFTMVDHTGFNRLMKLLEPHYQPEMYEKVCLKVKKGVSAASHVSITTDV